MSRRPATFTQADIKRAIKAAQQSGAGAVEVLRDGRIRIDLSPQSTVGRVEDEAEIVL